MPLIARGDEVDIVNTGHPVCIVPGLIRTLSCSTNVFVAGVGIHRKDDTNTPHTHCPPVYSTTINSFSPNVFANGRNVARQGDTYTCGAFVQEVTQKTVFANGY
jgi:uncharacterized Zn-binding protein involved in type VI secretion